MGFESWDFPVGALGAVLRWAGLTSGGHRFSTIEFANEMGIRGPFKRFRAYRILKKLKEVYLVGQDYTGNWFIPDNIMTRALEDADLCLSIGDGWMGCNEPMGLHCNLDGDSPINRAREYVRQEYKAKVNILEERIKVLEDAL